MISSVWIIYMKRIGVGGVRGKMVGVAKVMLQDGERLECSSRLVG